MRSDPIRRFAAWTLLAIPLTLVAPAAGMIVLPGCGCSDEAKWGLSVTVMDAGTGGQICDATVVATDGTYSETLTRLGAGDASASCIYLGASERPGTYSIQASSAGRMASATNVVVASGTCHVATRQVTITLPAAGG